MTCSREIPDFAQPAPRRVAFSPVLGMGCGREHRADSCLSEARRSEPTRYTENTVQADLVSAFRDGDRHYLLVVPAGGKPVRVDVTGRIGALLAYLGGVIEWAGL